MAYCLSCGHTTKQVRGGMCQQCYEDAKVTKRKSAYPDNRTATLKDMREIEKKLRGRCNTQMFRAFQRAIRAKDGK